MFRPTPVTKRQSKFSSTTAEQAKQTKTALDKEFNDSSNNLVDNIEKENRIEAEINYKSTGKVNFNHPTHLKNLGVIRKVTRFRRWKNLMSRIFESTRYKIAVLVAILIITFFPQITFLASDGWLDVFFLIFESLAIFLLLADLTLRSIFNNYYLYSGKFFLDSTAIAATVIRIFVTNFSSSEWFWPKQLPHKQLLQYYCRLISYFEDTTVKF